MNTVVFDTPEEPAFEKEAAYLANTYPEMLKQRDWLKQRIAGDWTYTKEMAIEELTNITVGYGKEHVQSSNISRSTEQAALMITDEFLAQRQKEYDQQRQELVEQLKYIEWKINLVERAVKERMNLAERVVFQCIYVEHRTLKKTIAILKKKIKRRYYNHDVETMKNKNVTVFEKELIFVQRKGVHIEMLKLLTDEAEQNVKEVNDASTIKK